MSRHSDREARLVASYLESQDVEYQGYTLRNTHYTHAFTFQGERVSYSHGSQRPSAPATVVERDAERGIAASLTNTQRQHLADLWRNRNH